MASAGREPETSPPAASMAGVTRSDAATGAAAPSSAQLSPPKAIALAPTATWANTTTWSRPSRPLAAASASAQKTTRLAATTRVDAPDQGPLPQPGGPVLELVQPPPVGGEALDRPVGQAEQPQLLGRRRVDGQPVGVVGVALGRPDLLGGPVAPDRALAQQPVGGQPGPAQQQRRPPGEPGQDDGRGQPADQLDQAGGDEVHRDRQRRAGHAQVEVAGRGQVAAEGRVLEVAHARRPQAGLGQPVVQPGGGPVARGWCRSPGGAAAAPGAARTPPRRRPAARPGRPRPAPPRPAPRWPPRTPPAAAPWRPAPPTRPRPGPGRPCGAPRRTATPGAAAAGSASDQPSRRRRAVGWPTGSPCALTSTDDRRLSSRASPASHRQRKATHLGRQEPPPRRRRPTCCTTHCPARPRPGGRMRPRPWHLAVALALVACGDGRPGRRLVARFAGRRRGSADGGADHAPLPFRAVSWSGSSRASGSGSCSATPTRSTTSSSSATPPSSAATSRAANVTTTATSPANARSPPARKPPPPTLPVHPRRPDPRVRLPPPRPLRLRHARHRPDRRTQQVTHVRYRVSGG